MGTQTEERILLTPPQWRLITALRNGSDLVREGNRYFLDGESVHPTLVRNLESEPLSLIQEIGDGTGLYTLLPRHKLAAWTGSQLRHSPVPRVASFSLGSDAEKERRLAALEHMARELGYYHPYQMRLSETGEQVPIGNVSALIRDLADGKIKVRRPHGTS